MPSGHKDAITDVKLLEKSKRLVSSSKDTLVKIWDLDTLHCTHTLVGHRCALTEARCSGARSSDRALIAEQSRGVVTGCGRG